MRLQKINKHLNEIGLQLDRVENNNNRLEYIAVRMSNFKNTGEYMEELKKGKPKVKMPRWLREK